MFCTIRNLITFTIIIAAVRHTAPIKIQYVQFARIFTARRLRIARTMPWQDVHLSACLSHTGIVPKRLHISSEFFHCRAAPPF